MMIKHLSGEMVRVKACGCSQQEILEVMNQQELNNFSTSNSDSNDLSGRSKRCKLALHFIGNRAPQKSWNVRCSFFKSCTLQKMHAQSTTSSFAMCLTSSQQNAGQALGPGTRWTYQIVPNNKNGYDCFKVCTLKQ